MSTTRGSRTQRVGRLCPFSVSVLLADSASLRVGPDVQAHVGDVAFSDAFARLLAPAPLRDPRLVIYERPVGIGKNSTVAPERSFLRDHHLGAKSGSDF